MFGLQSLLACIDSTGIAIQISMDDAVFVRKAAEVWEHTLNCTATDSSPYMLWASALFIHLLDFYSISSDVINLIMNAYEQYLQEAGGERHVLMKASAHMASDRREQRNQQAYVIILPDGLPSELRQTAPEHFLVVDSGATVHCLWDAICTAFLKEKNSAINWGVGHSVCVAIGHLCGVTFCRDNDNNWSKIIITSGASDAWVIPNSARMLFSQVRAKLQGHRCIMEGPSPGLILGDTGEFVPFVIEEDTQFCLFPMYPPPSTTARHSGMYSTSMRVVDMNTCGSTTLKSSALAFNGNPLVSRILLKRKIKRVAAAERKQRKVLLTTLRKAKLEKQRVLEEKRKLNEEKKLLRARKSKLDYHSYHRKCGHASLRNLVKFKKHGKVIASRLPARFLRDYRKECPVCLAMKRKRKPLPKSTNPSHLQNLVQWEECYTDSSGKFKVRSKQGNYYFTVFVCGKTGDKIVIPHAKRKHYPLVYFQFTKRIGRHPKVLYSDLGSEMTSNAFERYLLVKGVNHITVPRGEHHSIGVAEKAIQDLKNMMRCFIADSNVPSIYWDFIVEHAALVNSMTYPSICDSDKTIFEAAWGVIPNIDLIPPLGCFCARLTDNTKARSDSKLDPKNEVGVFLGFATRKNTYGAQILVQKSVITAKQQIAYDIELFPFNEKDNSNNRLQFFQWLLNRKATSISAASDKIDLATPAPQKSPYALDEIVTIEDSSDDEEVDNLMQDVENLSSVPPFNILEPEAQRKDVLLHVPREAIRDDGHDNDLASSPPIRRSSRRKRSSLSTDTTDECETEVIPIKAKKLKKDTATKARSKSASKAKSSPIINADTLRANKTLLIGKKLKKFFPGFGGAIGTVTNYILEHDAYELHYADGHIDMIQFNDILKLIPKSWSNSQAHLAEETVNEDLIMHVEAAALIAHITTDRAPINSTSFTTPKDYFHAVDPLRTPDYKEWIEAIRKEYYLLDQTMGCWEVVDISSLPANANLIGVKWVFKIKFKNGVYERHKARIVALGYQQRKDVDYFASFSPTASYVTIRLILALTALPYWYGVDLDATGAFISAPLPPEEQVYLKGIPGFELPDGKCLRLKKTIYGLVQAPLSYFKLCKEVYHKVGLRQLDSDECVFVKYVQNIKGQPPLTAEKILESGAFMTMETVPTSQRVYASCIYPVACLIIVMYVDNNGVRHNCDELLAQFEADVAEDGRIDLHREGDMSSFLSVRYLNNTETGEITADQEPYIDTLLSQYEMTNCNPNKVPIKTSVNLDEIAARLPSNPNPEIANLYAKLIGELMFVAINTQPLIAQPVNSLARFMTNANAELYTVAKGVLRYLKGHKSRKITWCAKNVKYPFVPCELYAYSDASWADVVPQRKSSLCYLIFCNNAVFSWKSTLSSVLAMSSAEAELVALCACAADIAYCRKIANELGFLQLRPTVVHEDNVGAKQLAESGNFKGRSKHYELRWRFLHHYINRGILSIKAVKRDLQLADVGTAPRGAPQLESMGAVIHGEV